MLSKKDIKGKEATRRWTRERGSGGDRQEEDVQRKRWKENNGQEEDDQKDGQEKDDEEEVSWPGESYSGER